MKSQLKYLFSKFGYQVTKIPRTVTAMPVHEPSAYQVDDFSFDYIKPSFKYSPWIQDVEFMDIYKSITENTLVDIYRCYELWELVETVHNLDKHANFLEVGVWRGGTAAIISRKLSLLNATVSFYVADTFTGVVKATDRDFSYTGGEHGDTTEEIVESLLKDKYKNYKILAGVFPDETGNFISPSEKFGFCHIDVDVYQSAKDIVEWIWERLIVGGVIVYDDFGFSTCTGITKYVNEQKKLDDRVVLYNLNGHATIIKIR